MQTQTKKQAMYERITKHGEDLKRIFNLDPSTDPVKLCKSLRRLELKVSDITTALCNGTIEQPDAETKLEQLYFKLNDVLGFRRMNTSKDVSIPVIINRDPRGYALKIDDNYVREHNVQIHRDMGGYGIIAPDLTND